MVQCCHNISYGVGGHVEQDSRVEQVRCRGRSRTAVSCEARGDGRGGEGELSGTDRRNARQARRRLVRRRLDLGGPELLRGSDGQGRNRSGGRGLATAHRRGRQHGVRDDRRRRPALTTRPSMTRTPEHLPPALRAADISPALRTALSTDALEPRTLTEWTAIDQPRLAQLVARDVGVDAAYVLQAAGRVADKPLMVRTRAIARAFVDAAADEAAVI